MTKSVFHELATMAATKTTTTIITTTKTTTLHELFTYASWQRHYGRLLVNSHLSEDKDVNWKARLLQSTYNSEFLFGSLPLSSQTKHHCSLKGDIKALPGDILPQVKRVAKKPPSKVFTKASFAAGPSGFPSSSRSQPGFPFRSKGRGKAHKPKAQEPKATPPPPPKPKQPKKSKRK